MTTQAKRRILLVDDDPLILATVRMVLQAGGYETAEAGSAAQALALVGDFCPDLALLDISMPDVSGIELAQRLQQGSDVPFMFVSAHAEADIVRQAAEHGAVGYLLKPFDIAQIAPALEAALGRADDIRQLRRSEANLTSALHAGRETSMAVGLLMARYHADRERAFDMLRTYARSQRAKVNDVAQALLQAEELLGRFHALFAGATDKGEPR